MHSVSSLKLSQKPSHRESAVGATNPLLPGNLKSRNMDLRVPEYDDAPKSCRSTFQVIGGGWRRCSRTYLVDKIR